MYERKEFIIARKNYKDKYGEYPVDIIFEYVANANLESVPDWVSYCGDFEYVWKIRGEVFDRNWNRLKEMTEELVAVLNSKIEKM